jgi:hypothetical protein
MRHRFVATVALSLYSVAAARTDFSDVSRWRDAVGPSDTLTFSGLEPGTPLRGLFADRGLRFMSPTVATNGTEFIDGFGAFDAANSIEIRFDSLIHAVALDFTGELMMVMSGNSSMIRTAYLGHTTSAREFAGFVSPTPFDHVVIANRYGASVGIDDVSWSTVPGPSVACFTYVLGLLALRPRRTAPRAE